MSYTPEHPDYYYDFFGAKIEDITDVHQMTNAQLKCIIQEIEVDKDGNGDIYLRMLGDLAWTKPF